jgi:hypothetical protein
MVVAVSASGCGVLESMGLRPGNSQAEESDRIGTQSLDATDEGNILRNEAAGIEVTLPNSWQEDTRLRWLSGIAGIGSRQWFVPDCAGGG